MRLQRLVRGILTRGEGNKKDGVEELWSLFKSVTDSFATYWTWRLPAWDAGWNSFPRFITIHPKDIYQALTTHSLPVLMVFIA